MLNVFGGPGRIAWRQYLYLAFAFGLRRDSAEDRVNVCTACDDSPDGNRRSSECLAVGMGLWAAAVVLAPGVGWKLAAAYAAACHRRRWLVAVRLEGGWPFFGVALVIILCRFQRETVGHISRRCRFCTGGRRCAAFFATAGSCGLGCRSVMVHRLAGRIVADWALFIRAASGDGKPRASSCLRSWDGSFFTPDPYRLRGWDSLQLAHGCSDGGCGSSVCLRRFL